jgi:RimJ/RimL family protein N-acetyltransferase
MTLRGTTVCSSAVSGANDSVEAGQVGCFAWPMTGLQTERLILHRLDIAEARRIVTRRPDREDRWAPDFPCDDDVRGVTAFLEATATHGEHSPFGHYRITRTVEALAIGGIGFNGQPVSGSLEIGYGLVPSARGNGYGAEAVRALIGLARRHGLARVVADTDSGNIASQRTLERAGFSRTGTDGDLALYAIALLV